MNRNEFVEIKDNIVAQAKYFLENADEFYPFGAVVNKENKLKPVGIYLEEDNPASKVVLIELEKALKNGIDANEYLIGAIGVDVYLTVNNEKRNALEVRIYTHDMFEKYYYLYLKDDDGYSFHEHKIG